jgi:hypothetical protein
VEAWNTYARYLPKGETMLAELQLIEASFDYFAHSWSNIDRLVTQMNCLPVKEVPPALLDLTLLDNAGKVLETQTELALSETGQTTATFVHTLPFGEYALKAVSKSKEGKVLKESTLPYHRVRPEWYENALGVDRSVPKPWIPIRVKDRTVSIWGRELSLGDDGLLQKLTAVKQPVLVKPITITATIGGKAVTLKGDTFSFTETADDRITWTAPLKGGGVEATLSAWMEYDGLIYTTVTLKGNGATLDALTVDIPMRSIAATQVIANGSANNFRGSFDVRFLPEGEGRVWDSKTNMPGKKNGLRPGTFLSQIWVGNDDCGLHFSAENDQGWTINDEVPAQELIRRGDQVLFRLNVVSAPTTLSADRPFHFLLLPTPTKPLPSKWRNWSRGRKDTINANYEVIDDFQGHPLKAKHGEPAQAINFVMEPHSWEDAAKQAEELKKKFGRDNPILFYMDYSWAKLGPSFKDWNHDLHAGAGRMAWTVPEVEDYMVWIVNEYIRRDLIDGIYVDDTSVGRNMSLAGTAYLIDGDEKKRRAGFSFMGFRRFNQRLWKLFQAKGKDPHILPHMTFCYEMPALSFCMAMVNGEARDIKPHMKRDTMQTWGRHSMRIMGNAKKWGIATFWKPPVQIEGGSSVDPLWKYQQSRAQHAQTLQYDLWYLWGYPTVNTILPVFQTFDMASEEVGFIPHWKMGRRIMVKDGGDALLPCAWTKTDSALVMVSNFAEEDKAAVITIDAKALFGETATGVTLVDADTKLEAPKSKMLDKASAVATKTDLMEEEDDMDIDLDENDPAADEAKRLEATISGNTATVVIRRHDYRIFSVKAIR